LAKEKGASVTVDEFHTFNRLLDNAICRGRLLYGRHHSVRRALLRTGDEDPDTHYALRDVLRTVVLTVGILLHFRLAVVASSDPIAQVCTQMQEELRALGCHARVFRIERQAEHWLRAGQRRAGPLVGELAVS
jgi:hypothetical protein